jgi:hypothetical protein
MAEYEALTRRLFFEEGNVKRFRTLVVMDRSKATMAVPRPARRGRPWRAAARRSFVSWLPSVLEYRKWSDFSSSVR